MTSDHKAPAAHDAHDPALAPPPDASNPALLDLNKTFAWTLGLAAAFIGSVVFFILL